MKIEHKLIQMILVLAVVNSTVLADRKPDSDKRTTSTTNAVRSKVSVVPQTSPNSSAPGTKANQVDSSVSQPATTDTTLQPPLKSPLTGEQIKWQVISGGGGRTVSANYVMSTTVGQAVAGFCSSVNYHLNAGFWQNFTGGGCCLSLSADSRTGNVDADAGKGVDIADLSALIDFLYISFTPPQCMQSANIDGDSQGGVDISDLSALIDFLYISFTAPAVCQ